jgi:hypothetical protein
MQQGKYYQNARPSTCIDTFVIPAQAGMTVEVRDMWQGAATTP